MSIYDKASLVLIPSGSKTSKVYSQKPVSGDGDFTFSRSTAATRVNADGNIEKETQNLLLHSNTFSNASWIKTNSSVTGSQSGYDGTNDAWLLSKSAASGNLRQNKTSIGVQTLSIYAKAGTLSWVRFLAIRSAGNSPSAFFNLSGSGSVGTASGIGFIDASIESIGSGWYRCQLVVNIDLTQFRVYPADGDGDVSGASGNIVIQDAQLEQGLVARDYIETTTTAVEGGITDNVPRLDYTDSSCPALLLEPQRTNLVTNSEYFASSDYTPTALDSVTLSSTISPEGVANAYEIVENTQNTIHRLLYYFNYSSGETFTFSVFAKSGTGSRRLGLLFGCGFGEDNAVFDLSTGQVTTQANGGTGSIVDMGNGWYKCSMTATANNNGTACAQIQMRDGNNEFYLGNGSNSILLYGAQLEEASYATSYIPTYGSAVTRNGERPYVNGINNVIGGTEGTIFFDIKTNKTLTSTNYKQFFYYTDANSAQAYMYISDNNYIVGNPNLGNIVSSQTIQADTRYKIAVTYKANDFKLYINGSLSATRTSGNVIDAVDIASIGSYIGNSEFNEFRFNSYMHFQQVLSNEELADLTTL